MENRLDATSFVLLSIQMGTVNTKGSLHFDSPMRLVNVHRHENVLQGLIYLASTCSINSVNLETHSGRFDGCCITRVQAPYFLVEKETAVKADLKNRT